MSERTQAERDFDLSTGREIERKDAEIERLRKALIDLLDDKTTTYAVRANRARAALGGQS